MDLPHAIEFFFGALYLFTINAVFIGISAVAMSQVLKFPSEQSLNPVEEKELIVDILQ
jgi:hypothetical protein